MWLINCEVSKLTLFRYLIRCKLTFRLINLFLLYISFFIPSLLLHCFWIAFVSHRFFSARWALFGIFNSAKLVVQSVNDTVVNKEQVSRYPSIRTMVPKQHQSETNQMSSSVYYVTRLRRHVCVWHFMKYLLSPAQCRFNSDIVWPIEVSLPPTARHLKANKLSAWLLVTPVAWDSCETYVDNTFINNGCVLIRNSVSQYDHSYDISRQ